MQTGRLKIGLIFQNDITIVPADQFKSEEIRPEHRPEFKLSDPNRPAHRPEFVLADIYHPGATKGDTLADLLSFVLIGQADVHIGLDDTVSNLQLMSSFEALLFKSSCSTFLRTYGCCLDLRIP
ncbi:hypothetical protein MA16_Dca013433 [Dendrobium catenatum]|uniref:Uncharacterized protein n=1 Tax=Dendrobium catenatum TaxID=906689 RepID=A0A2I0X2X2_9ASPA|nr:hypothetical protein MA16_Dca013433 [Dendrobium catenatum]